jgi:hypothetical protein
VRFDRFAASITTNRRRAVAARPEEPGVAVVRNAVDRVEATQQQPAPRAHETDEAVFDGCNLVTEVLDAGDLELLAGASVTADVNEKSLRYRLATVLPGRGYRKLISRLVASQQEYFAIDRAIRNVWYGEGGTGGR